MFRWFELQSYHNFDTDSENFHEKTQIPIRTLKLGIRHFHMRYTDTQIHKKYILNAAKAFKYNFFFFFTYSTSANNVNCK